MSGRSNGRFKELDGLRGLAAMWVVVFHLTWGLGLWLGDRPELIPEFVPFMKQIRGIMAVHLFFIISGFVISMTVERVRVPLDFVVSRFARLFPAYWAAVALAATVHAIDPLRVYPIGVSDVAANLTMGQLFLGYHDVDPSYWSLAVELGFYVAVGLGLLVGAQRRMELTGLVWMVGCVFGQIAMRKLGHPLPWPAVAAIVGEFAPLFYAGLLYYRIWSDQFTWTRAAGVAFCFALLLLVEHPRFWAVECLNFVLFTAAVSGRFTVLRSRAMVFLGTISYCLYLTHQTLGFRIQRTFHGVGLSPWANLAGTIVVLIAIATVMTFVVERPAGRWIRQAYANWRKRRATEALA